MKYIIILFVLLFQYFLNIDYVSSQSTNKQSLRQYYLNVSSKDSLKLYTRDVWSKESLGPGTFVLNGKEYKDVSFRFRGHSTNNGRWNRADENGTALASGVYWSTLIVEDKWEIATIKLLLLR
jgi:hypothetical protein